MPEAREPWQQERQPFQQIENRMPPQHYSNQQQEINKRHSDPMGAPVYSNTSNNGYPPPSRQQHSTFQGEALALGAVF